VVPRLGAWFPIAAPVTRWFTDEVIVASSALVARVSSASYRDLSELARELGVRVAPSTILRWVVCYAPPEPRYEAFQAQLLPLSISHSTVLVRDRPSYSPSAPYLTHPRSNIGMRRSSACFSVFYEIHWPSPAFKAIEDVIRNKSAARRKHI